MKAIADALELLTAQHEEISADITGLDTLVDQDLARALGELADKIATHLFVEGELRAQLHLVEAKDSDALYHCLEEIFAARLDSTDVRDRIRDLETVFQTHATSQDDGTFMALADTISPEMLEQLGTRLGELAQGASVITHQVSANGRASSSNVHADRA